MLGSVSRASFAAALSGALLACSISGIASAHPAIDGASAVLAAGEVDNAAVFHFLIQDQTGAAIPGKLTFVAEDGSRPNLFPNAGADPEHFAIRRNVVYTIDGTGSFTVPPGKYNVYASHGLEWSIDSVTVDFPLNGDIYWTATLIREVDTTGWVSGDFHLHTLTYSGHGDSNMPERVISLVGEGVEFAVATDHNHVTDYAPTIERVQASELISSIPGNEVSTSVGHFNAFPMDPEAPLVPSRFPSAQPLFSIIRQQTNDLGIVPVIQLNHPRWADINYFGHSALDPVSGTSTSDVYSDDFDTIEIFNENEGWGYYDPDVDEVEFESSVTFSVLRDWFNLLNRGHRYAAVGNSDSHTVESEAAGYPRNFLPSTTDDPAEIDPEAVAEALRGNRVFTTIGPFVEFSIEGAPMGGDLRLGESAHPGRRNASGRAKRSEGITEKPVELKIKVQAASWVDCDRVKVVVNGDIVAEIPVPDTRKTVRLDTTHTLGLTQDAWVALLVEGDDSLAPIVQDQGRPVRPLAVLNPIWIDVDGDGAWTAPYDRATQRVKVARAQANLIPTLAMQDAPADRALLVQAAAEQNHQMTPALVEAFLKDNDRYVRLSAAWAARELGSQQLLPALESALGHEGNDPHMKMALLMAMVSCGDTSTRDRLLQQIAAGDTSLAQRFSDKVEGILGGDFVREWMAIGYFDGPTTAAVTTHTYAPESDAATGRTHEGKEGEPVAWRRISAFPNGRVNLGELASDPDAPNNAVAYLQCWLISPDARDVTWTLGSDDGSKLWIDGKVVCEDPGDHAANPLQHVGVAHLRAGPNRVLLKVSNGGGEFGAFFRVLDDEVSAVPERP